MSQRERGDCAQILSLLFCRTAEKQLSRQSLRRRSWGTEQPVTFVTKLWSAPQHTLEPAPPPSQTHSLSLSCSRRSPSLTKKRHRGFASCSAFQGSQTRPPQFPFWSTSSTLRGAPGATISTPLPPLRGACDHLAGQHLIFWPQKLAQEQPWDPPEFSLGINMDTGGLLHQ